jgi:hypothetical protein
MSDELNRVYEALQKADEAGNVEDAKQLASYARQLEQQAKAPAEEKEIKPVEAQLNDIMYPAAGAVAGAGVGGATTAGRIIGGLKDAAKAADPVAMEQARRIADKNAVETWARTQQRDPFNVQKHGLYFGGDRYDTEAAMRKEIVEKMKSDPEFYKQQMAQQTKQIADYEKRIAAANPTMAQKVGRFLGKAPMGAITGGLTGLGAGFQASDAINRYNQGDKLGSIISGLGAAGTGLAMVPHPVTRIGGTAVGIGAELLNGYIDQLKKNNPFDKMMQQPQQPQPQKMAHGGKVKSLSKAQRAMKHFADGGSTSAPTIMSGQTSSPGIAGQMMPPATMPSPSASPGIAGQMMPAPQVFSGATTPAPAQPMFGFGDDVRFMGSTTPPPLQPWVDPSGYKKDPGMPAMLDQQQQTPLAPLQPWVDPSGYKKDPGMPAMLDQQPMVGFGDDVRFMDTKTATPLGGIMPSGGIGNLLLNSTTQSPMQQGLQNLPNGDTGMADTSLLMPYHMNLQSSSPSQPMVGTQQPMIPQGSTSQAQYPFLTQARNMLGTNRAPMNPFNPGFATARPAVTPSIPKPGMMPQPPRQQQQPFSLGFRGPISQQRTAAGLSHLISRRPFR